MKTSMMWKAAACAAAVMGMALIAGCGGDKAASSASSAAAPKGNLMQQIKQRGKLVIGTASGFPPYEFIDTSKSQKTVAGIDIALAQKIADKLGVKLEVQDMNFSAILSSIAANKVDIAVSGITPTEERKKAVDFSDVYLSDHNVLLVRKEDAGKYKTLADFNGKKIGVQKSTQQEKLAKEYIKDGQVVSLDKVGDALMEMQHGKVDAVPVQRVVARQYLIMNPEIAESGVIFEGEDVAPAIAVPKGNEDLLKVINEVIKESNDNGDFQKWVQEYSQLAVDNAKK